MSCRQLHLSCGLRELGPSQQNCGVNKAFWALLSYTLDKLQAPATGVTQQREQCHTERNRLLHHFCRGWKNSKIEHYECRDFLPLVRCRLLLGKADMQAWSVGHALLPSNPWDEYWQCQNSTQALGLQLHVCVLRLTFSLFSIQHHNGDVGEVSLLGSVCDSKLEDVSAHL